MAQILHGRPPIGQNLCHSQRGGLERVTWRENGAETDGETSQRKPAPSVIPYELVHGAPAPRCDFCRRDATRGAPLERKDDSLVLEFLELLRGEGIELGGTSGALVGPLLERREDFQQFHFPAEIALVEDSAEYGFVDPLHLGQRELLRQQLESHGRVLELVPQAL